MVRSRWRRRQAAAFEDDGPTAPGGVLLGGRDRDDERAETSEPSQQEEAANRTILNGLISRHSVWLPEEDIRRTFEECLAQFSSARIRDFVPVLAHRCANAKLQALASDREHVEEVRMTELLELEVRSGVSVHESSGEQAGGRESRVRSC
jgi:hypothetical protein